MHARATHEAFWRRSTELHFYDGATLGSNATDAGRRIHVSAAAFATDATDEIR